MPKAVRVNHRLTPRLRNISRPLVVKHSPTLHQRRVYAIAQLIPEGKVTTYGAIAKVLHSHARAVGQALRHNPFAPIVPCHRIVASDGSIGGFSGHTTGVKIAEKIALLRKEGVRFEKDGKVDRDSIVDAGSLVLNGNGDSSIDE